jgi:hypothetical protein
MYVIEEKMDNALYKRFLCSPIKGAGSLYETWRCVVVKLITIRRTTNRKIRERKPGSSDPSLSR